MNIVEKKKIYTKSSFISAPTEATNKRMTKTEGGNSFGRKNVKVEKNRWKERRNKCIKIEVESSERVVE